MNKMDKFEATALNYPLNISGININNIVSYNNLKVTNIGNEFDDENYEYGFLFSSLEIDVNADDVYLYLYVAPTGSSATLGYKLDDGITRYTTIYEPEVVEIELNNTNTVTLTSSNQNILLYYIYKSNQVDGNNSVSSYDILNDSGATYNPGNVIYGLPTDSEIRTIIEQDLSNKQISYESYTYSVSATISALRNSSGGTAHDRYFRIIIDIYFKYRITS